MMRQVTLPVAALCVVAVAVAVLSVAIATGGVAAADDPIEAGNGTYETGQSLAFEVAHDGDGYQVRDADNALVSVETASDGIVVLEDTDGIGPGTYTLEHGDTGTVAYRFTLEEPAPTPTATPTPEPEADEPLEHENVWASEIPRAERSDAVETDRSTGLRWLGELLHVAVEDGALVEVYDDDGNHVRTLIDHRGDAYLPTADLPPDMYTVRHENDDWSFRVGLVRQEFDVSATDETVTLESNRDGYAVLLSSETIPDERLAAAFPNASHVDGAVRIDGVERGAVTVAYDTDEIPDGDHDLTLTVADAGVPATVTVTGTGPELTEASSPTPTPEETSTPDATATPTPDGAPAEDATSGDDDLDLSAPGFSPTVAAIAVVIAALLAGRSRVDRG